MRPLQKLQDVLDKYVVMSPAQRLVIALWIVHAHCVEFFDQTAYLLITSPEKRCGKTTLLELIEFLVPRPFSAITPSEAVVFRTVDAVQPTLLLDEIDTIFSPRAADKHEGLRALLNAGNRKGATVPRCVGTKMTIQQFKVYCAKLIAGIGTLPDTIVDRSIPIRLQRKTRAEQVERFRRREAKALTEPVRAAIAAWVDAPSPADPEGTNGEYLGAMRPDLPEELNDRAQDFCEPLIAVADALGYGEEARAALVELLNAPRSDSTERAQVQLLRDVRNIYVTHGLTALHSHELISWLHQVDGWASYYGHPLNDRDLASLLKPYGIFSKSVWSPANNKSAKGYHRDDFISAWERYLTDEDEAVAGLPAPPNGEQLKQTA